MRWLQIGLTLSLMGAVAFVGYSGARRDVSKEVAGLTLHREFITPTEEASLPGVLPSRVDRAEFPWPHLEADAQAAAQAAAQADAQAADQPPADDSGPVPDGPVVSLPPSDPSGDLPTSAQVERPFRTARVRAEQPSDQGAASPQDEVTPEPEQAADGERAETQPPVVSAPETQAEAPDNGDRNTPPAADSQQADEAAPAHG